MLCTDFLPERGNEHFHVTADILNKEDIDPNCQCTHAGGKKLDDDCNADANECLSQNVVSDQR